MPFGLICTDKPGRPETRLAVRDTHFPYLQRYVDKVVHAGPVFRDGALAE